MRNVKERIVTAPPLIIQQEEIDILISRACLSFDEAYQEIKQKGLWSAKE